MEITRDYNLALFFYLNSLIPFSVKRGIIDNLYGAEEKWQKTN